MGQKKAAFHNLGCKVNEYEMEAMQELLEQAGYEIVPFAEGADVYVINTCTVTNIADRKSRQMLHRARKFNPEAVVVAAGCYVQTGQELLRTDPAVDILLGNDRKQELVRVLQEFETLRRSGKGSEKLEDVLDLSAGRAYENLSVSRTSERVRANIKVTDGCNQFCSYCLIPYARGRVRSRRPDEIVREIRALAETGYCEFVITGIHLSSYGRDFPETGEEDLLSLLRRIREIPGVHRIRLGSLEPGIITEGFVQGISEIPQICPHFHLSLQSGCDATLRRMNRHYTSEEYAQKCQLLRRYFRTPALTTDIIVGFPGETREEFLASKSFIEDVQFYETHIFKYSRRDGTRAAMMPDQIQEDVKEERSTILQELGRKRIRQYERSMYGRTLEVLLEEEKKFGDGSYLIGHSKEYVPVAVPSDQLLTAGDITSVPIMSHLQEHLLC